MTRTELILVMSTTLFAAFVLGWLLRWAYSRLNQVNSVDVAEIDDLASRLHDAEVALDETRNALVQKEHELEAAMGGIGNARRETEHLREQLESLEAKAGKKS
jgi:prophage endopeptidase